MTKLATVIMAVVFYVLFSQYPTVASARRLRHNQHQQQEQQQQQQQQDEEEDPRSKSFHLAWFFLASWACTFAFSMALWWAASLAKELWKKRLGNGQGRGEETQYPCESQ